MALIKKASYDSMSHSGDAQALFKKAEAILRDVKSKSSDQSEIALQTVFK